MRDAQSESPAHTQQRLRFQAPRLVAEMLGHMPPEIRRQLQRRLGLGEDSRPGPGTNMAVLLQLAQHEAARQKAAAAPGAPGHTVSLDKAWHGLHYLLCGTAGPTPTPLGQAVFGGSEIGAGRGYGPARYFPPTQVAEIAAALKTAGLEATLRKRFDIAAMTQSGIYPGTWENDDRRWLIDAFRSLRDFYAAAGAAERAVVTIIE